MTATAPNDTRPRYRFADGPQMCTRCASFQPGCEFPEGRCQKHERGVNEEYVCDDFEWSEYFTMTKEHRP